MEQTDKKPVFLTLNTLELAAACFSQRMHFFHCFGREVEVSETLAVKYASQFDWQWLISATLGGKYLELCLKEIEALIFGMLDVPAVDFDTRRVRAQLWARYYTMQQRGELLEENK